MDAQYVSDRWERGNPYERCIGRWSRLVAPEFLAWLGDPRRRDWVDVGCGTGALSATILVRCAPARVVGVEASDGFRELAMQELGSQAELRAGTAADLPLGDACCDMIVSGLVLNFVPDIREALVEMCRVAVPGGTVAAYVWDYAGGMEVIRLFWDAAVALDPAAAGLHEGTRFPVCTPEGLRGAFDDAGLADATVVPLDLAAEFTGFDDYWQPFLGGQGPAPAYVASLTEERRSQLGNALRAKLSPGNDPFRLGLKAWAVRGSAPGGR